MPRFHYALFAALWFLLAPGAAWSQPEPYPEVHWQALASGKDFTGWKLAPHNGQARFEVRDEAFVGTTVHGQPCTYLQTEKLYGNFILECEFLAAEEMNAGVQFRSLCWPQYNLGRVHGYQFEIAGSASGGIFDESRRGWITTPLANRTPAEIPFLRGEWNEARILAIGDRLQTWTNGVPMVELHDSMTPAGYIALQLHDTRKRSGDEVRWRNLRIKDLDRALAPRREDPFAGPWKGATSNHGKGLYAKVEKRDGAYAAAMFENPELSGEPLATLTGRAEGARLALSGADGWTGRIDGGVFTGKGRARAVRLVVRDKIVEPTGEVVAVDFVMMPGTFRLPE